MPLRLVTILVGLLTGGFAFRGLLDMIPRFMPTPRMRLHRHTRPRALVA